MTKRYIAAAVASAALIAMVFGLAVREENRFLESMRPVLRELKSEGKLPNDFDPETVGLNELSEFGIVIPRETMQRLQVAGAIQRLWFLWIPIVVAVCFGAAWLYSKRRQSRKVR